MFNASMHLPKAKPGASMQFRFYLLSPDGAICAAEHFSALDDREALAVAASLWEACADVCSDYDLWQGTRPVSGGWHRRVHSGIAQMSLQRQQDVSLFRSACGKALPRSGEAPGFLGSLPNCASGFPGSLRWMKHHETLRYGASPDACV